VLYPCDVDVNNTSANKIEKRVSNGKKKVGALDVLK
jgi:hypothetical protein